MFSLIFIDSSSCRQSIALGTLGILSVVRSSINLVLSSPLPAITSTQTKISKPSIEIREHIN